MSTTDVGPLTDAGPEVGAGTCASPINLTRHGAREGDNLVYRGTTVGLGNNLQPYEGCVARDAAEAVLSYQVPMGVRGIRISTAGSTFDTALYVRTGCSQAAGGSDLVCNNDSYDSAPHSTVYVNNLVEGQVLFIVVDGNVAAKEEGASDAQRASQGSYVLTVSPVTYGAPGMPCRPATEPPDPPAVRCDGDQRCSEGGAADGTSICVAPAANDAPCDPRQYDNRCPDGSTCVTDPAPPEGTEPMSLCSAPGSRRGALCRTEEPRCPSPFVCGEGEEPRCVPVVAEGLECDPTRENNRCAMGLTCGTIGMGTTNICR